MNLLVQGKKIRHENHGRRWRAFPRFRQCWP